MRVNAEGTAFTVQAVLPHMRAAGWGRIVLLSSGTADGAPGLEQYAAAKAALHGLAVGRLPVIPRWFPSVPDSAC